MKARWERWGTAPPLIELDNLPPSDLAAMLGQMLRLAPAPARELAQVLDARSGGNPFDTVELVDALRQEGILAPTGTGWRWTESAIRRFVGRGDVLDLMTARI